MADLKELIADRIAAGSQAQIWTPVDFLDIGSRDAVDKALQRLVSGGQLRRIDRGLYDTPRINRLTKRPAVADYRHIVDALARRDQVRMLVDGLTAANDLGRTAGDAYRAGVALAEGHVASRPRPHPGPALLGPCRPSVRKGTSR